MIHLRPRLLSAASLLEPHRLTVDIGTDHAYLPAYLIQSRILDSMLACDIGIKPLENAAATIEQYGLAERIELRVSDGLKNVSPSEVDQISICGMGGNLIVEILSAAEWIRRDGMCLVLQPMTHFEDVREYLCLNGFRVVKEVCVRDTGRLYCCIKAVYDGVNRKPSPGYCYFGEIRGNTPEEQDYIRKQISRVRTRAEALRSADRFPEEEALLRQVIDYYNKVVL